MEVKNWVILEVDLMKPLQMKRLLSFFLTHSGFEIRTTTINKEYNPAIEVENFVWADAIIYHTLIWWFQSPHGFKKYIDVVFTAGHSKGIYKSDRRSQIIQQSTTEQEGCFMKKIP